MGKPWAAYSWLFEIIIYGLFARFGLFGILIYCYGLLLAITASLYALIRKFEQRLAQAVGLTALALVAMTRDCSPRPWLFTILCFCLELNILVSVRRSRNYRKLFWLLPLFVLWANTHIQFVYGFLVLGAAVVDEPLTRLLKTRNVESDKDQPLPMRVVASVIGGCLIAVLFNPYHFKIYSVLLDTFRLGGLYSLISELQALPFRSLPDWLVLVLVLGAAYVLGKKGSTSPFWILLLAGSSYISFRANRDIWFVVIVAATIIASSQSGKSVPQNHVTKSQWAIVSVVTVAVLFLTVKSYNISNAELQKVVDKSYPTAAAAFVEQNDLKGPLYNHSNWGGYLIWRLPQLPVAIDGRSNLHTPDRLRQSYEVWRGKPDWSADSELQSSNLVIAEKDFPLTQLLRLDHQWRVLYEDEIAVVFVRVSKE